MVDLCFNYFLLKTKSQCIASARRSFDQEKKKIKKRHLKRMKRCLAVPGRTRNDCYWLRKLTRSGHRVNRKNLKNTIEDCDSPTASPTDATSDSPTGSPTFPPTDYPTTDAPTDAPTDVPSAVPSDVPSGLPSDAPSDVPSAIPSDGPSSLPSDVPSDLPSAMPSDVPSGLPSDAPSTMPSDVPSSLPSDAPSDERSCFNNADIVTAVTEYFDNKDAAVIKYGEIGSWLTCRVTTFEYLFAVKDNGYFDESYSSDDEFNYYVPNYYEGSDDSYSERTFNQDLNDWDLSSVTSLHLAFKESETFNGRISNWDVSLVENFRQSFNIASAFNQNISDWDVSSSSTFYHAFGFASSFNQCLEWVLMEGADTRYMFASSPGRLGPCGSS